MCDATNDSNAADRIDREHTSAADRPLASWWPAAVMHGLVLLLGAAMLFPPGHWGGHDWDYFAHHYEAMRRTVLEYGQFPWWNPWSSGGIPLATNPQIGLASINFPLVVAFGTYLGLKLALIAHLVVAAEGARWLAAVCTRDAVARALAGFVFVANGSVALYVALGHVGIELIAFVPWAIGCALRMKRDPRWGYALGGVLAAAVLTSFQYFVVYLFLWLAAQVVWQLWASDWAARRRIVIGCCSAASVFLALAGLRTALAAELILDFPRGGSLSRVPQHVTPAVFAAMLALPQQRPEMHFPDWFGHSGLGWHEFGCYVGVGPLVLLLGSLKRGWRWWHTLVVVSFCLALGNHRWYHASAWLTSLPILSTLRVASRWRVLGVLGIALGCGAAVGELRAASGKSVRWLAIVLAVAIAADLACNAWPIYREVFVHGPESVEREPGDREFVHVEKLPASLPRGTAMLAMLRANYGVVYSYEPLIGSDADPISRRVWRGHEEYVGEYWSLAGPVRLVSWSPNAIVLEAPPNALVFVNQNRSNYWRVNGRATSDRVRSVDRHGDFVAEADASGRVELTVWPKHFAAGLVTMLLGVVGLPFSHFLNRVQCRRRRDHDELDAPN